MKLCSLEFLHFFSSTFYRSLKSLTHHFIIESHICEFFTDLKYKIFLSTQSLSSFVDLIFLIWNFKYDNTIQNFWNLILPMKTNLFFNSSTAHKREEFVSSGYRFVAISSERNFNDHWLNAKRVTALNFSNWFFLLVFIYNSIFSCSKLIN